MSKTETVYNILRKRLEKSLYPPGTRFPSESTLATEFSVNKMTMNKIVSMLAERGFLVRGGRGSGTLVADYKAKARGLIAFQANIHTYTALVLRGVVAEAARNNFMVIMETPRIEELQHRMELLKSQGVTGIISMGYGVPDVPEGMRLVCVDSNFLPDPAGKVRVINSDNFQGGALMMKEILRRGHRDILIFSSERFVMNRDASITPRVQGFHSVMRSAGIRDFEARTFYSAPNSSADCREFLRSYLKKYPGATLIAADSDYAAELLYKEALQLGVDCPGKIALTGFGNITLLPIASVDQAPERQGELAARFLASFQEDEREKLQLVDTSLTGVEHIPILTNNGKI